MKTRALFLALVSIGFLTSAVTAAEPAPEPTSRTTELHPSERLLAPTPFGPVGLFRTISAQFQPASWESLGFSVVGTYYTLSGFPAAGQESERLAGWAALSYTPLEVWEVYVAGGAFTNNGDTAANLIQQVGNMDFGTKFAWAFHPVVSAGLNFTGHFRRALTDLGLTDSALSYDVLGVATFDLLRSGVPLRIHANAGYRWDGTDNLIGVGVTERERIIADILGQNAFIGALGIEVPISPVVLSLEYTTEQTFGTGGVGYFDNPQRLTVGGRYFPTRNRALALELGTDIGFFFSDGAARIRKEPNWNLMAGLTYMMGTAAHADGAPTSQKDRGNVGTLRGTLTDTKTGEPVPGGTISLCAPGVSPLASDPKDGTFASFEIPAGSCEVVVQAKDYETLRQTLEVQAGETLEQNFALQRTAAPRGVLVIRALDEGGIPMRAGVELPEVPKAKRMATTKDGKLRIRLPAGGYKVRATAAGRSPDEQTVNVAANADTFVEFTLRSRLEGAMLAGEEIRLLKPVDFASGQAVVRKRSRKVLDDVAVILVESPEIKKVEIQGHTDSSGRAEKNKALSQKRAQAVLDYLTAQGLDPDRLRAVGYGEENPIANNKTVSGRKANRRVEFKIISE